MSASLLAGAYKVSDPGVSLAGRVFLENVHAELYSDLGLLLVFLGGDAEEPFGPFPGPASFRGFGFIFLPWSRAILPLCVGWLVLLRCVSCTPGVLEEQGWQEFVGRRDSKVHTETT
eukprot:s1600_g5.t1